MKRLISYADRYMEKANWKDIALLKTSLCSLGIVIGASASEKTKKPLKDIAKVLFVITYIPIMIKAISVFLSERADMR